MSEIEEARIGSRSQLRVGVERDPLWTEIGGLFVALLVSLVPPALGVLVVAVAGNSSNGADIDQMGFVVFVLLFGTMLSVVVGAVFYLIARFVARLDIARSLLGVGLMCILGLSLFGYVLYRVDLVPK